MNRSVESARHEAIGPPGRGSGLCRGGEKWGGLWVNEWRHEAVRWFDQWLKGRDTGILDEPRFAVFVRQWHPPGPYLEQVSGEWRWEEGWPIERIEDRVLYPQPNHTLAAAVSAEEVHRLRYVPSIGVEAGGPVMWWGDVAHDQRPTDAFSLVYDSDLENFYYTYTRRLLENGRLVREKAWQDTIPRDYQ